ncbi:MAG: hypothetical protein V3T53_01860 [Phycisphaerales bacterium]
MIFASGVLLAGLILIVLINIDPGLDQPPALNNSDEIVELILPELDKLDLSKVIDSNDGRFVPEGNVEVELPDGGWIRFVDPQTGELAQQYRFQNLDPSPPGKPAGWLQMEQPEAEMFLSDGRVMTLSGRSALAFAPNRKLESGTVTGDVWIRLFAPHDGRAADPDRDSPILVVRTEEAAFNNFLGEVRCEGEVNVESPSIELPSGRGLTVLMDDQNDTFQLSMEHPRRIRIAAPHPVEPSSSEIAQSPIARDGAPSTDTNETSVQVGPAPSPDQRDAPRPSPASADVTFYRLTLNKNVHIRQGKKVVVGDTLSIVFSMQSQGVTNMMAKGPPTSSRATGPKNIAQARAEPLPLTQALAALAIASFQDPQRESIAAPPSADDIIIDCDGSLTIVPVTDPNERPASAEDALLTLTGNGRPVHLLDPDQQAEAQCARLLYRVLDKEIQLVGSAQHPLWVTTPELHATGDRFWYRSEANQAGFVGPGRMTLFQVARPGRISALSPRIVISSLAALGFLPQPVTDDDQAQPSLQITWQQRVDLQFEPGSDADTSTRIRTAAFVGDVTVVGESFALEAETMQAGFSDDGSGAARLESIDAAGDVRAHSLGSAPGELACRDLKLSMMQTARGRSIPTRLIATGQVMTRDAEQTMWAETLDVSFREMPEQAEADGRDNGAQFGDFEIQKLIAVDEAQLRLNDGARVLAERIDVDGIAQTANVTGENILLLQDNLLIDQVTRLEMDRKTNRGRLPGPGRLRIFQDDVPLQLDDDGRAIQVAVSDDQPQVNVHWTISAMFDGAHDHGNGAVDFNGSVRVDADPSRLEHDTVQADSLRLELARDGDDVSQHDLINVNEDAVNAGSRQRSIRKMIATGNAKLQSRTWEREDHSDMPRVFFVAGELIDYNHQTGEALVDSPGTLLIRDERRPSAPEAPADDSPSAQPRFATTGTTSFHWSQKMEMTRAGDDLFDIVMTADIQVRHLSLDGEKATLTADRLEATVQRSAPGNAPGNAPANVPGNAPADGSDQTALDLGGPAELVRVHAIGLVFLRTTNRDVQCDEFDYDVKTGLARLTANPGRRISVLNRGATQPFHAEEILWDMANDRITIIRAAGAAGK